MLIGTRLLLAAAVISLAGCSTNTPAARAPGSASPSPSLSAGPSASVGANATSEAASNPSATATLLCGSEIRGDIMTVLALRKRPVTRKTWIDHLYTCIYDLPTGPLVLSVQESGNDKAGKAYFDATRISLKNAKALTGMQNLGQPGYETTDGVVVLLKDDKTLRVDATRLPTGLGPHRLSPTDLAYEIATDILGCWNGK